MNKNLFLNGSHDLEVGTDLNLRMTSDLTEYVSQKIECALLMFKNEWFLDRNQGVPYYDRVLIKGADLDDVNSVFLMAVKAIPEVSEIISFETDFNNQTRKYSVNFKVRIAEVEEVVQGEVVI